MLGTLFVTRGGENLYPPSQDLSDRSKNELGLFRFRFAVL